MRNEEDALVPKTKARSDKIQSSEAKVEFGTNKSKLKRRAWLLKDLKAADYNPRYITEVRLKKLAKSIQSFGDLSGVVFNARTNRLISGHQRLKSVSHCKTKVVTQPHTDSHGTIETGHIEAYTKNGVIKIPFRVVDWSNSKVEKAANVAANSHGGEFDQEKLRKVLVDLDTNTFDIELLGLDPITIMSLSIPRVDKTTGKKSPGGNIDEGDDDDEDNEFEKYDANSFQFACQCPKCGYQFDPKEKRTNNESKITKAKSKDNVKRVSTKKPVEKVVAKVKGSNGKSQAEMSLKQAKERVAKTAAVTKTKKPVPKMAVALNKAKPKPSARAVTSKLVRTGARPVRKAK